MEYDARDASDQDPVKKSMKIGQEISEIQQKQKITNFNRFLKKIKEYSLWFFSKIDQNMKVLFSSKFLWNMILEMLPIMIQ